MASILSEFDEVGYKEMIREEAYEDAYEEAYGEAYGKAYGEGEISGMIKLAQNLKLPKSQIITMIKQNYNLSDEEISEYMQELWKD